ncbi:MAG: right-handed parallel beta-helix repeat-containing protein, partial [Egibacteraceae bacterium]
MVRAAIHRINLRRVCFTALAAFGVMASPAFAQTYYVDEGSIGGRCDDARTAAQAASVGTPWCSLTRAVGVAPSNSTVLVRAGDYPFLSVAGSRSRSDYVTFSAFGDETARVGGMSLSDSSYLAFDGLTLTSTSEIGPDSDNIRLTDNTISADRSAVVLQDGASKTVIEGNRITSPRGSCVFFSSQSGSPAIVDTTIRGNVCDGAGVTGVNARNFSGLLI